MEFSPKLAQPCPLCGGFSTITVGKGRDFEFASTPEEWSFKRCKRCDVLYLDPRPDFSQRNVIYSSQYYPYTFKENEHSVVLRVKSLFDRMRIKSYLRRIEGLQGKILDIGCGDGHLLSLFEVMGVNRERLTGLDFNDEAIRVARARGYTAVVTPIENYQMSPNSFSLIIMNQVIEHLADPRSVIRKCIDALEPGGYIFLETPNTRSLDFQLFSRRYWGGYHFPRHWVLFNSRSIKRLFEGTSLRVVSVRSLPSPFVWTWSFHHWLEESAAPRFFTALFHWKNPFLLALFTLWDLFWMPFTMTSNLQVIVQKLELKLPTGFTSECSKVSCKLGDSEVGVAWGRRLQ